MGFQDQQSKRVYIDGHTGPNWAPIVTYLVTTWWLFSLSADLLDEEIEVVRDSWKMKIQLSQFLRNRLGIVPASTKSSPAAVSVLANQRAKKWEVEWRIITLLRESQLYPCSSYQFFFKVFWKDKNCSLIKIYRMNQSILEKISNQIPPNDCEPLESHESQLKLLR